MLRAYKVRLKTNDKLNTKFRQCAGVARYVYNWGLAEWKRQYEAGEKPSYVKLNKQFNAIKREQCAFVTEYPYAISEAALRNLETAFKNFFRRVKQGADKAGYPKFKKRGISMSFQLRNVKIFSDRVRLPLIGEVGICEHDYIPVSADYGTYATVSERAGYWYLSVLVDNGKEAPAYREGSRLGVDVGIKTLAVFSDGNEIENPKALAKAEKKLARLQQELSRRAKGSKNREKTNVKVARLHERVSNIRRHAQHQASHYATRMGGTVVIETLNVKGMMQNAKLARSISDVGMYEIHRQIEYKAKWRGARVVKADQWFASSKTCSGCGYRVTNLTLAIRTFVCPECGLEIDRDLNAARNLAALV